MLCASADVHVTEALAAPGAGKWDLVHRMPYAWSPAGCFAACPDRQMTCVDFQQGALAIIQLALGWPRQLFSPGEWRESAQTLQAKSA